jgi:hypothetical protein
VRVARSSLGGNGITDLLKSNCKSTRKIYRRIEFNEIRESSREDGGGWGCA